MTFVEILRPSSAVFLDFDGTLVDIAPQPEAVHVPDDLLGTLRRLQAWVGGAVAVVSGRPIKQIDAFLAPLQLAVAGVHGAERRRTDGSVAFAPTVLLDRVEAVAHDLAMRHPALRVEHKRGSLALHYRQAPELEELCTRQLQAAVDATPGLVLLHGKMVAEAKPAGASKGLAIRQFMAEPPFIGRVPVFIGDDVTDEAGFATVQDMGGIGVKVGSGPTMARQRLADPATFRAALDEAMAAHSAPTSA